MSHSAHLLRVLQVLAHDVQSEACRSVVHGPVVGGRLPAAIRRADLELVLAAGVLRADEANRDSRRAQVLLKACVDVGVLADVDRLGAEVGGHVRNERHGADVRRIAPLHAVHRLVGAVVDVRGLRVQLPSGLVGDAGELRGLGVARSLARAVLCGLLVRLLAPLPSDEVVRLRLRAEHVEGHRRELQRRAALREDHLVVGGHAQDVPQVLLRLAGDLHELLGTVRHLHDAHTTALVIDELFLDVLENLERHHAGTSREVVHTPIRHLADQVSWCWIGRWV
mmetsp:Transcript_14066/g.44188  ORF Transcript_14066/g.44188 Transcript_14066/m.44188 type:complete len:281 (-) Transcript_14066:42-884(-)